MKEEGFPVISYAAGEPDFPTPTHIVEAAKAAAADPQNHRYSPVTGLPELRAAIASQYDDVAPEQVLVTNGGKQAVYQAFAVTINPGDEVLLPAPYWTTYPEAIGLCGGVTVPVFASADQGYKVTVEQLERAYSSRTKALVICSPSNPTGATYTQAQLRALSEWATAKGLWIITDEIYQFLDYEHPAGAPTVLSSYPQAKDNCICVSGVAKTYAMTGWRVGWMVGPPTVIKAAAALQSHLTSNVNNIAQRAALAALTGPSDAIKEMRQQFDRRRLKMVAMLQDTDGLEAPTPTGAFYVFADARQLLGTPIAGKTAQTTAQLADILLEEASIATVPGEAFGAPGYLRFSYALAQKDMEEGLNRLQQLLAVSHGNVEQ